MLKTKSPFLQTTAIGYKRMSKMKPMRLTLPADKKQHEARKTLSTCGFAHFIHDGLHDALYILLPLWAQMFGLSLAQVGLLKAIYSGTLSLFQIPAGILAERYGERILLVGGTIVAGIGYTLLSSAGSFTGLLMLLAFVGLGSSVQHPLSSTLVARAYPAKGQRAALGIYNFTGDLGKMGLPATVAIIAGAIGWQSSVIASGLLGTVAGLLIFFLLRQHRHKTTKETKTKNLLGTGWGIKNEPAFLALSGINIVDTTVIYGFLTFLPFLLIEKGAAVETLGLAIALTFAGGAAGKFLCGVLAERIGIIKTSVITILTKGICILILLWLPLGAGLVLLPLLGAALNGTSSVLYATVAELVDPERHSRSFGLFYTLGMAAGAVSPVLFGVVSDFHGVPAALTMIAFSALLIIPFCLVLQRLMRHQN